MNIILLTTSYPLSNHSSSGIFVKRLADALSKQVVVHVVTPSHRDFKPIEGQNQSDNLFLKPFRYSFRRFERLAHEAGGIPVILKNKPLYYLIIPIFLYRMMRAVQRQLKTGAINIIHANWSISGVIACFAARKYNIPVLTTLRGEDFQRASNNKLDKWILDYCVTHSASIAVVSQEMQTMMHDSFGKYKDKIHWVPNGVSTSFSSEKIASNKEDVESKALQILTVGSLIKRKRIDDILHALNGLEISAELTIIGSGPEESMLRQLSEDLAGKAKIHFIGSVPPNEVVNYFAQSDLFILASASEGRPNVLLESMASGVPIISTDISGSRELVQAANSGELYQVGDTTKLAELIIKFSGNIKAREIFSENGMKYIQEQHLTWESAAGKYFALYQNEVAVNHG